MFGGVRWNRLGERALNGRRGCGPDILPLAQIKIEAEKPGKPILSVQSRDAEVLERTRSWGADEIVYEPSDVTEEGLTHAPSGAFALVIPPTLNGDDLDRLHRWATGNENISAVLLSNPAHLALTWPCPTRLDAPMNLVSSRAAAWFGLPYTPSEELTAKEIARLGGGKELFVYGRLTLMRLRHCPLRARLGGVARCLPPV